ncbi:hypothetical protein JTE90_002003 [Oedothorax gibbosus]|uniref:GRIP domain-containing protein n=1 Tax=Oedothorax gibbosus TaxID=931172 RepID=A0AAV6U909_9ARAC|nr:hypothetical protein JTE90_002003 [Oedothorax gibbosus]
MRPSTFLLPFPPPHRRKKSDAARFIADDSEDEEENVLKGLEPLRQQIQQLESELEHTRRLYREATSRVSGDRQAEYTLRFLKDAVFYFLTKKDREHLKAIQSILGFTEAERTAVHKATKHRRLFSSPFKFRK